MRFAIVGCGYISRVHLTSIKKIKNAEAVAVVDKDKKKAEERAAEFGIPRIYTNWQEAFKSKDVDAAIICLPHKLHYACVMDALNAGKHVFVEKPISIASKEAADMIESAKEKELTLMAGHMKRFDRRFVVMKEKIDAGAIGKVFLAKSEWIGPKEIFKNNPWAADPAQGGGPLMGFGSHHIDLLHWLIGPIKCISCYTNNLVLPKVEVEDSAVAILEFENGAIGNLIYSWGAEIYGQDENMVIHGTEGTLKLENEKLYYTSEKTYKDRTPRLLETKRSDGKDIQEFGKELALSSLEPFTRELEHFIDCIETKRKPLTGGEEAEKAVDVIIKAYQSAAEKSSRSLQ